jgi:hypothetical protein
MKKSVLTVLALVGLFVGSAHANDGMIDRVAPDDTQRENPFSLDVRVDVTNGYSFRGLVQEDKGTIVQPSLRVGYDVLRDSEGRNRLEVFGSIWESIHTEKTGAARDTGAQEWYENDLMAGANLTVLNGLTLGVNYSSYMSPSDAFNTVQEVQGLVALDDSGFFSGSFEKEGFHGFQPYALVARGLDGHMAPNGQEDGTYLEVGIRPGVNLYKNIRLTVPLRVGFNVDNYYDDGGFGYRFLGVGPQVEIPLSQSLSFTAGVEAEFRSDKLEPNDNDDTSLYGKVGLRFKL